MSMKISTTSVPIVSDRGNAVYQGSEQQIIRIFVDPASVPLLDPKNTYLRFSFQVPDNQTTVPDPAITAAGLIETLQILSGDESTVIENLNNLDILTALKNFYSLNNNKDALDRVFKGKVDNAPEIFTLPIQENNEIETLGNTGAGCTSVMHDNGLYAAVTESASKKCEVIMPFDCSGFLSPKNDSLIPLIAMNGLVLKIRLRNPGKVMRELQIDIGGDAVGKGVLTAATGAVAVNGAAGNDGAFNLAGCGIGAAAPTAAAPTNGQNVTSLFLSTADSANANPFPGAVGANNFGVPRAGTGAVGVASPAVLANLPCKVGQKVIVVAGAGQSQAFTITGISVENAVVALTGCIRLDVTPALLALQGGGNTALNDRVVFQCANSSNLIDGVAVVGMDAIAPNYLITDLQMICGVIDAPEGYVSSLLSKVNGGGLNYRFNSYVDYPMQLPVGNLVNELYIPATQQQSYTVLSVLDTQGEDNTAAASYRPGITGLSEYQYFLNEIPRPMNLIPLTRVAASRVEPQQIIELEKAIEQSSIDLRNIVDAHTHFALGISLGRYGNTYDLLKNNLRLRLMYTANATSQTLHNFVYHSRILNISKNGQRIIQ